MIKVKYLFFVIILTFLFIESDAQTNFVQKKGYLVFVGDNNTYNLFFIESHREFNSLLKINDTLCRIIIGVPGDDASNVNSFKIFLEKNKKMDSLNATIIIEDNNGLYIEVKSKIFWQKGIINYFSKKIIPLNEKHEKLIIKNKKIFFKSNKYIPIESFHPIALLKLRNKKYRKF